MNHIDLLSLFTIAISASFGHCIGMCGGIVIAYSNLEINGYISKILSHFIYGFGRITTYSIIGGISAFVGDNIGVSFISKGAMFIVVGLLMVVLGLSWLLFPRLSSLIEIDASNNGIFKSLFSLAFKRGGLFRFYVIGILNGLIPCGIVYFFALSASVSGSILNGMFVMFVFGLATLAPMVLFGLFASFLSNIRYRTIMHKIFCVSVIVFGLWTIFKGLRILLL